MLVLIGPDWNPSTPAGGRRLDAEHDYVRHEVGAALRANMWIIPVLFGRAAMPGAEELPDDVRELAFRQKSEIHDTRVDVDTREIIDALRPMSRSGRDGGHGGLGWRGTWDGGVRGVGAARLDRFRVDLSATARTFARWSPIGAPSSSARPARSPTTS